MHNVGLLVVLGYSVIKRCGRGLKYTLIFLENITVCINFRASVRETVRCCEELKEQR